YNEFLSIKDLFPVGGTGIVTKRDKLAIQSTESLAIQSAKDLMTLPEESFRIKYKMPDDVRDWRYEWAKSDIKNTGIDEQFVKKIQYRLFDYRYVYYTGNSRG